MFGFPVEQPAATIGGAVEPNKFVRNDVFEPCQEVSLGLMCGSASRPAEDEQLLVKLRGSGRACQRKQTNA